MLALSIYVVSVTYAHTSDDVAQQNIASTIVLHPRAVVDLPQDTFIIKLPLYVVLSALPVEPQARLLTTALILNLTGLLLFYGAARSFIRTSTAIKVPNLIPLLWLASLGVGLANVLINPNSRNLEIGLAFAALAALARWYRGEWRATGPRGVAVAAVFVVLLGLLFYDDPYIAYMLAVPLVLVFGTKWLLFGKDRRALILSATVLAAAVCAKGWHWLFWFLGIHAGQGSAVFVSLPRAAHNAQLFGAGVLELFNANIFGRPIWSIQSLAVELNFLILLATLLSPSLLLLRRVRQDIWKVLLLLLTPIMVIAFIGSTVPVDGQSLRYLVALPFYAALVWAVVIAGLLAPRPRLIVTGIFVLATILNVVPTIQAYRSRGDNPNAENQRVANIVKVHHLTKGYASFWNAGINQYYADNSVLFIQSGCSPATGIRPYRWLLNGQVLSRPASDSFYLLDPATTRCTEADLAHFFGQPQQVIPISGQKRLLLFGYDISGRLRPE
jgi:hypothetical protein